MNKQIIVKGLLVSYIEIAGQRGEALLFLHGWRSNKEAWSGVVSQIEDLGFNIYALDFPGFGQSQTPQQAMTVGDYAVFVEGFIKKLELKNVVVVGHSFGGRVGIKLSGSYPEIVKKLVLVDSAGFADKAAKKTIISAAAKIVKPFFKPAFMQGLRKKIYRHIGSEDYIATPELRRTYLNAITEDLSVDMKNVTCPTLIINGQNDLDTPVEFGRRMQSLINNSQFIVLERAGHFSFVDQPEMFIEKLKDFLK